MVCFTHGFFIKSLVWRSLNPDGETSRESMAAFRDLHYNSIVGNAQIFPFALDERLYFSGRLERSRRAQALD